ncbi:RecT family recombinase [Escherichia coli]|uniref:RecT family recombinase n=1 Tax=Escherichia coli TaxID=562 RepID=UPI001982DCAB|nr:RecT family recombinase [Escherichia coli]MDM4905736.1 RecT family recombinase [Escherichia coli]MED0637192.1 RecT family recombinase [Escherichia marmotae]HAM3965645.1 recombinase RecT [Escherichia coli]
MNELTQQENINSNVAVFSPQSLAAIQTFSQVMASGMATVPEHLRGNPSDCMAITMQAMQWQMNPYAVAQKTFVVNGVLGYEAQLVNAVISTRGPLTGRIEYDWFGPWEKIIGKFEIRKSDKGKEYRVPGWKLTDENGIGVRVQATLRGESKPRVLELLLAQARTRNSTLWADDPRQQLAYLALKRWARLYCPEVILGVYTRDELDEPQEKIINPVQEHKNTSACRAERETTIIEQDAGENWIDAFRERIEQAQSTGETTALRQEVEDHKNTLGALYTELKGKVVQRHHRLNAIARIEKMINDLPSSGDPEAEQKFTALENTLNAARPHLGELYEAYKTTLTDMKPEYIGS